MFSARSIITAAAIALISITLQGCRGRSAGQPETGPYGDHPPAVMPLDVNPSDLPTLSALWVEAMTVQVEQQLNNESQALVNHSGFVKAVVTDVGVDGQTTQPFSWLSLSAVARLGGKDPVATVEGLPLNRIFA